MGFWPVNRPFCPAEPRFGITNACITERAVPPASSFTVSMVCAASATGRGLLSGADGTAESTVKFVEESRKSSFR